ncbi:MAG: hypothetical protein ACRC5C_05255, partial [Bacilli bacterium]
MQDFDRMILIVFAQYTDPKKAQNVRYLLAGYRSVQTMYEAKVYGLTPWYGLFPDISANDVQAAVDRLSAKQWLVSENTSEDWSISEEGRAVAHADDLFTTLRTCSLWQPIVERFRMRFLLFTQMMSYEAYKQNRYVPIVQHLFVKEWVKMTYRTLKTEYGEQLATAYGTQLMDALSQCLTESEAEQMTQLLTGVTQTGATLQERMSQTKRSAVV